MSLPGLLGLLVPLYSISSLHLASVRLRPRGFGFWPSSTSPSDSPSFLGRFFQLLVQLRALCVLGAVLGLVGLEKNGIYVRAQQQQQGSTGVGGKNRTLSVTDLEIAYEPPDAFGVFNALGLVFMRASEQEGLTRVERIARLDMFQGSALYYTSPLFPFDARVHFQLVLSAEDATSSPSSNDGTTPVVDTVIFDQTLFLRDNSTAQRTDGFDSIGPTSTQTFVISESLDDTRNYTAIVKSDLTDETVWTWVGQFVITSPDTAQTLSSSKPNLKVILPTSIIGSLIVIAIFIFIALFLRRRTKNRKQAELLATYPPTPRAGSSDEKFEFSLVRPRGERSSILPTSGSKSRNAGGTKKPGGASASAAKASSNSKAKGLGSTRGIVIPSGGPRRVENVNEYGLQFEPLDLTGENNEGSSKKNLGKSAASSREGGGGGARTKLNVEDEDELVEAQQGLAYRSQEEAVGSTKSFSPNRPSHSHSHSNSNSNSNSQSHSTVLSHHPYSLPQSSSSPSRHPTISMVSHNEHNIHSRHSSRKWDNQSVRTANTAEMLVKDIPYLQYLHRIADTDGTLISVKSNNSQSMEGSGSGEHRGGFNSHIVGGGGGTMSDHESGSPTSNLNPFGIPPPHQQARHPYATAGGGGTVAHRSSGASGSSHESHRTSGLLYAPQLAGMVTESTTAQAAAAAAVPVAQSQSYSRSLANAEPAPRGVAEFGSKASLGLKPVRRRRTNSGANPGEEESRFYEDSERQVEKDSGQGVSAMLGSLRLLGAHLQPGRRRRKESSSGGGEEDLEAAVAAPAYSQEQQQQQQQQRQPGHVTPKKSSSSTSLKVSQISAPMPIKPTRPPATVMGSSSPPSSYSAPSGAAGAYPPPAPTPTPPLGASWTKRKAVPKFDESEGAAGGGGSGSTTKQSTNSSTSLVGGMPQPPPLPLPLPLPAQGQDRPRDKERERKNSAPPPVLPPRSPSRQRHQHRQAPLAVPVPAPAPEPEPEPAHAPELEPHVNPEGAIRPLPPRPLPHTPTPPASQTAHGTHGYGRNVPSVLGGSSIGGESTTIVAPSTPSTAVGYYQAFHEGGAHEEGLEVSRDSNDLDDMYGEEPELEVVQQQQQQQQHQHPSSQSYLSQQQAVHPTGARPMPTAPVPLLGTQPQSQSQSQISRPGTASSMFTPPLPLPPPPPGFSNPTAGGKGYYDPVWYPDVVQPPAGGAPPGSSRPVGNTSRSQSASASANRAGGVSGARPRTKRPVI
ncbi:hypothetical protein MD484_g8018, partial [Candolleomyces efflorescens]